MLVEQSAHYILVKTSALAKASPPITDQKTNILLVQFMCSPNGISKTWNCSFENKAATCPFQTKLHY